MYIYLVALLSVAAARPRELDATLYKRQAGSCGQTVFNESYGIIETPYYPYNYGDNMDCVYTINGNSTSRVNFLACVCYIEDEFSCSWDYIKFGGNASRNCGNTGNRTFSENFSNGVVEVVFHSDSSVNFVGCQISYGVNASLSELSSRCPGPVTTPRPHYQNGTNNETTPSYNSTQSSNWTTPSYNWTAPPSNWTTPSYNWTAPPSNWTTPSYNWTAPSSNWTTPSYNWTAPSSNWTTPSYNWTALPTNWTTPSYNWTAQPSNWTTPSSNWTSPPSNSSVNDLILQLSNVEFELLNKFQEYRDLVWQIINSLQ